MANSKRHQNDWVKYLSELHKTNAKTPEGDGWFTYNEIFKMQKLGENKVRLLIKKGIEEGSIISFEGSQPNSRGRLSRRIWYKFTGSSSLGS